MKLTVIAATLAIIWCLATAPVLLAKGSGHGGGHSGGGHSGGGHSGGGHSAGGHAGGGHSSGGGHAGGSSSHQGASHPRAATPSRAATGQHTPPPPAARPRENEPIIGTAVPRAAMPRDLFLASPSTYAPHFVSPFVGAGIHVRPFGFGRRFRYPVCWGPLDCAPPLMYGFSSVPPVAPVTLVPPVEAGAEATGLLRLDVQPLDAQIFVDGYFVGTVMDFFQTLSGLNLAAGPHHLEFRAPDYETLAVDVQIDPDRTITYRATLKRIR